MAIYDDTIKKHKQYLKDAQIDALIAKSQQYNRENAGVRSNAVREVVDSYDTAYRGLQNRGLAGRQSTELTGEVPRLKRKLEGDFYQTNAGLYANEKNAVDAYGGALAAQTQAEQAAAAQQKQLFSQTNGNGNPNINLTGGVAGRNSQGIAGRISSNDQIHNLGINPVSVMSKAETAVGAIKSATAATAATSAGKTVTKAAPVRENDTYGTTTTTATTGSSLFNAVKAKAAMSALGITQKKTNDAVSSTKTVTTSAGRTVTKAAPVREEDTYGKAAALSQQKKAEQAITEYKNVRSYLTGDTKAMDIATGRKAVEKVATVLQDTSVDTDTRYSIAVDYLQNSKATSKEADEAAMAAVAEAYGLTYVSDDQLAELKKKYEDTAGIGKAPTSISPFSEINAYKYAQTAPQAEVLRTEYESARSANAQIKQIVESFKAAKVSPEMEEATEKAQTIFSGLKKGVDQLSRSTNPKDTKDAIQKIDRIGGMLEDKNIAQTTRVEMAEYIIRTIDESMSPETYAKAKRVIGEAYGLSDISDAEYEKLHNNYKSASAAASDAGAGVLLQGGALLKNLSEADAAWKQAQSDRAEYEYYIDALVDKVKYGDGSEYVGYKAEKESGIEHSLEYEYVNNPDALASKGSGSALDHEANKYDEGSTAEYYQYLSDEERGLYNHIYATDGKAKAHEYIEHLWPYLEMRRAQQSEEDWQKYTEEHPVVSNIGTVLLAPGEVLPAVERLGIAAYNELAGTDKPLYIDTNTSSYDVANMRSTVRSKSSELILGDNPTTGKQVMNWAYQLGMSMADSASMMVYAGAGMGFMTDAVFFSSASNEGYRDAIARGATQSQAVAAGFATGFAEALFEHVSMDKLLKDIKTGDLKYLRNVFQNAGIEGSEEAFTETANFLTDYIIMGDKSNLSINKQKYLADGLSEKEADKKVFLDALGDVGMATLGGMLSGFVFAATGSIGLRLDNRKAGTQIQNQGASAQVVNEAKLMGGDAAVLAQEYESNKTAEHLGEVYNAMQEQVAESIKTEEDLATLSTLLEGEPISRTQAQAMAESSKELLDSAGYNTSSAEELRNSYNQRLKDNGIVSKQKGTQEATPSYARKTLSQSRAEKAVSRKANSRYTASETTEFGKRKMLNTARAAVAGDVYATGAVKAAVKAGLPTTATAVDVETASQTKFPVQASFKQGNVSYELSLFKFNDRMVENMSKGQSKEQFMHDLLRANLSEKGKISLDFYEAMGKALGVDVVIHDFSATLSGAESDGKLHFYLSGDNSAIRTFSHETLHLIKEMAPEKYTALTEYLKRDYGAGKFSDLVETKAAEYNVELNDTTRAMLEEEAYAELSEKMLSDTKALEKFANRELDTAKTFRKQLQKVSDAIHNALNKLGLDLGKSAAKDIKYAQETVDAWVDGMTTAISNAQKRKAQREQQKQAEKQQSETAYEDFNTALKDEVEIAGKDFFGTASSILKSLEEKHTQSERVSLIAEGRRYAGIEDRLVDLLSKLRNGKELSQFDLNALDSLPVEENSKLAEVRKARVNLQTEQSVQEAPLITEEQEVRQEGKKAFPANPALDSKNAIHPNTDYASMLQTHKRELNAMKPLVTIDSTAEYSKENSSELNQVLKEFKDSGLVVDRQGIKKVAFNEADVDRIANNYHNALSYMNALIALKSAKAVIKNGVEVGRSHASNYYGIEYDNITYAAPVIINGTRADIMVNVADFSEYKDGQVYCSQIILDNGETYSLNAPPRTDGKKRKKTKDELWLENYKKQKAKNEQRRQQEEETKAEQSNNRMFMLNDNFVTELHEWYKGDRNGNKRFYVGRTSEVLSKITGQEKDIYWYGSKINEIKKKHHNMTLPVIEQVPHILESPVMVLDSRTVDGRIVMFGDVYDKSGNPVLAAVELSASNGSIDDFVLIASAYARGEEIKNPKSRTEALQNFINESNVRYVTEDKKRIQSWLKRTGLQLPFGAKLGFNDVSISDSSENVNRKMSLNDSTGRELSKGQQEYFSESEVRDGKWRLLPVYHATDADFTEFKREYLGQMTDGNASSEYVAATAHLGFWFNTKDVSKSMWTDSSKTKEVYLNIENPYHTSVMSLADEMEAEYGDAGMTSAEMGEAYRDELISQGYDGIIADDEEFGGTSYVIFDSNQAKNVDNLNPTSNPDIRFSLNDSFRTDQAIRKVLGKAVEEAYGTHLDIDNTMLGSYTYDKFREVIPQLRKFVNGKAMSEKAIMSMTDTLEEVVGDVLNAMRGEKVAPPLIREYVGAVIELSQKQAEEIRGAGYTIKQYEKLLSEALGRRAYVSLSHDKHNTLEDAYAEAYYETGSNEYYVSDAGLPFDYLEKMQNYQKYYPAFENDEHRELVKCEATINLIDNLKKTRLQEIDKAIQQDKSIEAKRAAYEKGVKETEERLAPIIKTAEFAYEHTKQEIEKTIEAQKKVVEKARLEGEIDVAMQAAKQITKLQNQLNKSAQRQIDREKAYADEKREMKKAFTAEKKEMRKAFTAEKNEMKSEFKAEKKQAVKDATLAGEMHVARQAAKKVGDLERKLAKSNEKIEGLKTKHKADLKEAKETATSKERGRVARQEIKNTVRKQVKALEKVYNHPKNEAYVPQALLSDVKEFLTEMEMYMSGKSASLKRIAKLEKSYAALDGNSDSAVKYDESVAKAIAKLREVAEGQKSFKQLSGQELRYISDIINGVSTSIKNAVEFIGRKKEMDIAERANGFYKELAEDRKRFKSYVKNGDNAMAFILKNTLSPVRYARYISGYAPNSIFVQEMQYLNEGQNRVTAIERDIMAPFEEFMSKHGKEFVKWQGKGAELLETSMVDEFGDPVKISRSMRISLVLMSESKDNMRHLLYGGFKLPNMNRYTNGKFERMYETGTMVHPTKEQIESLKEGMTDLEKEYMGLIRNAFNSALPGYINETSVQLVGYKKARVPNYFPVVTDSNYIKGDFVTSFVAGDLENQGWLKDRVPKSSTPVLLEDVSQVFERQAQGVAAYAGLAIPIANFESLLKTRAYTEANGNTGTPMTEMLEKVPYGKSFVTHLLDDLKGGSYNPRSNSALFESLRGNYIKGVLALNITSFMRQLSSYPATSVVTGWKNTGKALFGGKVDYDTVYKYSAIAWDRSRGYTNPELKDYSQSSQTFALKHPKLDKLIFGWMNEGDKITVGLQWKAAEYWVRDHTDLKPGSEAFYVAVGQKLNETIQTVQENSTVMQRGELMRDKNWFLRPFTVFKTQQFQIGGMTADAVLELCMRDRSTMTKAEIREMTARNLNKIGVSFLLAATSTLAGLIGNAIRGTMNGYRDDDDELTEEGVINAMLWEFAESMGGMVIFGEELVSIIEACINDSVFYDVSDISTDVFNNIAQTSINLVKYCKKIQAEMEKEEPDTDVMMAYVKKIGKSSVSLFGQLSGKFPVDNAMKIVTGIYNEMQDISDALKHGTLDLYRHSSGKLDNKKTHEEYDKALAGGISGEEYFSWKKKLKDGKAEEKRQTLFDEVKDPKKAALLDSLLIPSDSSTEQKVSGTIVYTRSIDKDGNPKKYSDGTEAQWEVKADYGSEDLFNLSQYGNDKYMKACDAMKNGTDIKNVLGLYDTMAEYNEANDKTMDMEEKRSWIYENVSDAKQAAMLDAYIVSKGNEKEVKVEGSVVWSRSIDKDGKPTINSKGEEAQWEVVSDYSSNTWYALSQMGNDGNDTKYQTALTIAKAGGDAEKVLQYYEYVSSTDAKVEEKRDWIYNCGGSAEERAIMDAYLTRQTAKTAVKTEGGLVYTMALGDDGNPKVHKDGSKAGWEVAADYSSEDWYKVSQTGYYEKAKKAYSAVGIKPDTFSTVYEKCSSFNAQDASGKTVTGLKKQRVIKYLNTTSLTRVQKQYFLTQVMGYK